MREKIEKQKQLWQTVTNNISHLATQAFFTQCSRLSNFANGVATVEIISENLIKLAQNKIHFLEAAFKTSCDSFVEVKLIVLNKKQVSEKPIKINSLRSPNKSWKSKK